MKINISIASADLQQRQPFLQYNSHVTVIDNLSISTDLRQFLRRPEFNIRNLWFRNCRLLTLNDKTVIGFQKDC